MDFKTLKQYFKDLEINDENFKRDLNWLIKDLPQKISLGDQKILKKQINELKSGKPLAYVLKNTEFFGLTLKLNKNTLIPRFETELLVDKIIKKLGGKVEKTFKILDLCCGSGAIGIALQKNLSCEVDALDINFSCVKITKENAKLNNVKLNVFKSNMFENVRASYDLIVSNPPYIPSKEIEILDNSVKDFEPKLALDGGDDGLSFYRIIAEKSSMFLKEKGILCLEIGFNQAKDIEKLLKKDFCEIKIEKDYSNLNRFVFAKRRKL